MRSRMRGITLVELLIGLAVAAVVAGFGLPAFDRTLERMRTRTTASTVTTALMAARAAAITRGVPVTLCPSSNGRDCRADRVWDAGWIIFTDADRDARPGAGDRLLGNFDAVPKGLQVQTSIGRNYVRYLPSGLASGTNTTFRICSARRGTVLGTVIVSNTGRARSERSPAAVACS